MMLVLEIVTLFIKPLLTFRFIAANRRCCAPQVLSGVVEVQYTAKMKPDQRKDLQDCITYFRNHLHQMRYAWYIEHRMPIGSGVTEAACKTLVKQRLCCSGMRWTPEGAQIVLSLRALALTQSR